MNDDRQPKRDVDAILGDAAKSPPKLEAAFMDLLNADMMSNLPQTTSKAFAAPPQHRFWARFQILFAASGLTGAAALGLWIGFVMPDTLNAFADDTLLTDSYGIGAFLPSADLLALEE